MASGDIEVYGPFRADDTSGIDTGLTGNSISASDAITVHVINGNVIYTVVKA